MFHSTASALCNEGWSEALCNGGWSEVLCNEAFREVLCNDTIFYVKRDGVMCCVMRMARGFV